MIAVLTDRTMTPSSIVDSYCSGSLLGVTITKLETDSGFLLQTRKTCSLAVPVFSINVLAVALWARQFTGGGY